MESNNNAMTVVAKNLVGYYYTHFQLFNTLEFNKYYFL